VLLAALELGADGGYEAVQMRDVAASAEVALGTIYRYFPSKDALLAAAMLEWMEDLERRVTQRAPRGDTTSPPRYSRVTMKSTGDVVVGVTTISRPTTHHG